MNSKRARAACAAALAAGVSVLAPAGAQAAETATTGQVQQYAGGGLGDVVATGASSVAQYVAQSVTASITDPVGFVEGSSYLPRLFFICPWLPANTPECMF